MQGEFDREHRASAAFQHAALPRRLPVIPGMQFRAVYRAAKTEALVGGDWYDAFRLDDGRVVITIGDVMGKGLIAAVMMGAVRQSLRGAAQILADPIAILNAADRALRSEDPTAIVTAFVGVLDPVSLILTYASAGHPPPFLRIANGDIVGLGGTGLPLGLRSLQNYSPEDPRSIYVDHSALLVLYTDGLVEATRDIAGGEKLVHDALLLEDVWRASNSADAIADYVLDEVVDDVAILTIRFESALTSVSRPIAGDRDARWHFDLADRAAAGEACADIVALLTRYWASASDAAAAELAFNELLETVVRDGGSGAVEFALDLSAEHAVLHAIARGAGSLYLPGLQGDGDLGEPGRGLFVVRSATNDLTFTRRADGGSHARAVLPFVFRAHARRATATTPTGASSASPAVSSAASAVALSASSSPVSSTMRAPASSHRSGSARPTSP
jgi:hypothetical protein